MQTFLDPSTAYVVCCIVNLILSLALLLVLTTSRTYPGFRQWVLASTSAFVSMALLALLGLLPPQPTTLLVNLTFFSYPLLLARGLRRYSGYSPQNWIAYVVLTLVTGIAVFFTYVRPDPNTRVFLLSLLLVPLFADCAWLVRRVKYFAHPAVKGCLITAFSILAAWNLLRTPLGLGLISWNGAGIPTPMIVVATVIILTAANVGIGVGVILLNFARASESLRESEERFRNLAGAAFEAIVISENGRIIEANEQALRMFGHTREEMLGREITTLTPPESRALVSNSIQDRREAAYEHMLVRKDGSRFPVEAQAKMIQLGERMVRITALRDLSERQHMQQALEASEGRFRSAMQHSPIGMALVTIEGRWLEVNPALCAIVGYTRQELLSRSFQSITHPDDLTTDQAAIGRLVSRQVSSYQREKRYVHKDGHLIWVHVHVSIIFHADGIPQYLVSQIVDVTERKKTEQALREYQTKLILAMDAAKLGHWEFDVATGTFTFDENFYKLLGTSSAREGGFQMSAADYSRRFIPPEESALVGEEVRQALTTTDPHYSRQLEHKFNRADGSSGVMSVRIAIEKDPSGRTVRTYGLNQDITEQTRAAQQHRVLEDQLRHAQKLDALGTLAGGIAHDFNNIITGIMGNLQLAEMDLPTDHPAQAKLREADRASRRARDHVARVLTFSRRYQGDRVAIPLGPIVQEAVQLLRASLPANIEIRTTIAANCPPVLCDSAQIHQVVMNLGTNAAYAMRNTTGLLEVELSRVTPDRSLLEQHPQLNSSHNVRLTVRDTGSGMEKAVLARIFEPFFTTKAPDEGTGLGLAMVHGIVKDHLGAITVASTVGRGTTFTLYFPGEAEVVRPAVSSPSTPPMPRNAPFGEGRKIMLVDDDDTILSLGQGILSRFGFTAEGFANPSAALKRFQSAPHEFAAVISDLTMPGLSGVELARHIRAIRSDIPFILASGYLHSEAHGGAQESGVTHFVNKPFNIEELMTKLRSALGQASQRSTPAKA